MAQNLCGTHQNKERLNTRFSVAVAPGRNGSKCSLPSGSPAATTEDKQSAQILLVDDELVVGKALKLLFSRQGHVVTHCSTPQIALHLCQEDPALYDVMITDQSMPEMSGYDLAVSVSKICPSMPIFIQTGHVSKALREAVGQHGIQAIYQKPVSSKILCEKVLHSIRNHP